MMRRWLVLVWLWLAFPIAAQETPQDYLEAAVDNAAPFVGQPIVFTWRWYLATANAGMNSDQIRIEIPSFVGFGQETLPQEPPTSQLINGRQYQVVQQRIRLYPLQAGNFTLGAVRVKIPESPFAPAATLTTLPLAVTVQPLPTGAPPTFINAVGQFEVAATIDPTTVTSGQPLTLTLNIQGAGNLRQLLRPPLDLGATWRVYEQDDTFTAISPEIGTRTWSWVLIPIQNGIQTLPSIPFTFFNPLTQSYETRPTAALSVDVQGSALPLPTPTPPVIPLQPTPLPLKPLPARLATAQPLPNPLLWLLWLSVPLVVGGSGWWLGRRTASTAPRVTGSRALQQTLARLAQAQGQSPQAQCEQIAAALLVYVTAKSGQTIAREHLETALQALPPADQAAFMDCLTHAEAARYAPITADDAALLLQETRALVLQVDQRWQ
jgi:hypothetical protein